ncbi:unnamed protein product [Fusarium graminearum]|nr:unnamed protein product [Fusarium graminearum]
MPFYSSSGSSYRPAKKCQMRHCDREVGFYESSNKNSFYCPRPVMLITNAAHRQKTEKGSVRPTQFVLTMDVAKGYQRRTNLSVTQREAKIHGFARITYLMPLAPGSVIDTDVPLQAVQILSSTQRVIMSRDALNIPANDQAVVKKPVLTVQNPLSVFPTVA